MDMMLTPKRAFPLIVSLVLLSACGGKDDASDSTPPATTPPPVTTPPPAPVRGELLTKPAPLVKAYSTTDLLALLGGSDVGKELLGLAYTPKCGVDVYQLTYETVGGKGEAAKASGALMVPTGSDSGCSGPRPILTYAHGTTADKTYNIALIDNSNAYEGLLLAAVFASRGYIVVAPNYAGYDTSDLPYHPYLNADQQSKEMIDVVTAARSALPVATATTVTDNSKLFVTGYSQGGYVAMAAHKAMQAAGMTVTASAPMSGPYALAAFGDAIFEGEVNASGSLNLALVTASYQNAYGNLYTQPTEVFETPYAATIGSLLPSATPITTIYSNGQLTQDVVFSSTAPAPEFASQTPATEPAALAQVFAKGFGTPNLVTNTYRLAYLRDAQAQPDGGFPTVSTGIPAAAPTNTLRQDLKTNDLRNWAPTAPVLLCGGENDPTSFFLNTQLMQNYWTNINPPTGAGTFTVLDVDSAAASGDPYTDVKNGFAAAKALVSASAGGGSAGDLAVLENYHAGLVPPFCLSAVKSFFDAFQ
jgi:pimeloyl-ACP methyl ester carboxylesterase